MKSGQFSLIGVCLFVVLETAGATPTQKGHISGEIEQYLIGLRHNKKFVGADRGTRLKMAYNQGPFEAVASYYAVPLF